MCQALLRKVDKAFDWHGKELSSHQLAQRAAVQVVSLLLEVSCENGKSELLHTRLFCLLVGETYRSHNAELYEWEGAWVLAQNGISILALERLLDALERAQVYYLAMSRHSVPREFEAVVRESAIILSLGQEELLLQWQLADIIAKKQEHKATNWCAGAAELCKELRRQFSEHNKAIVRNFQRWGASKIEDKIQPGLWLQDWVATHTKHYF